MGFWFIDEQRLGEEDCLDGGGGRGVLLSNNHLNMMAFFLAVSLLVFPNVCVVSFVLTIGG